MSWSLPSANRRQEALRPDIIKGKPAQTFLRPDRKWIFGHQDPGKPGRIFYYQFFDPDHDRFANLTVFEFNPQDFLVSRRIFASSLTGNRSCSNGCLNMGGSGASMGKLSAATASSVSKAFPEID